MSREYTVALAGNPNAGKSTLFNHLTGSRQHVGNYPGVTVEKKEGTCSFNGTRLHVVDLPGTYSLTAYSTEELVARDFLINESPEAVVDILDATSLERNLYLAVQLMELGLPVVLALNMMDEVKQQGKTIDAKKLSDLMGVPVIETVARDGRGTEDLVCAAAAVASRETARPGLTISYGPDLDPVLDKMTALVEKQGFPVSGYPARWIALKYLEEDTQVLQQGSAAPELHERLLSITDKVKRHLSATLATYPEAVIADYRYGFIASIIKQGVLTTPPRADRIAVSDRIDAVLTHRLFGPLIMLAVLYLTFEITFPIGEIPMGWLESLFGWLGDSISALMPDGPLESLIVSGIIDGVGGVLGFVPLILCLFLAIAFLEDSGYMARMAYMLDRVLRIFGLHGSSVMPFIVSGGIPGGCAVPGVMAARTLKSPREKIATVLTAPYLSCGAKVPVYLLLAGAFFAGHEAAALFWITLGAWGFVLLVAALLRSTVIRGETTPFVMELPPYRLPTLTGLLIHTWERGWQYIKKAGTVILAISILIWVAMTYPGLPEDQTAAYETQRTELSAQYEGEQLDGLLAEVNAAEAQQALKNSAAGRLGTSLEPLTGLAGFDWRTNIALIGGFAAKEVIVSTLGTAYSLGDVDPEETASLASRIAADPQWTTLTAICLILFVMLYAPCFVTVVVIARETSWGWAAFSVIFNTVLAFGVSALVFQIGSLMI